MRLVRYCWILILALIPGVALAQSIPATQQTQSVERYYIGGQQPVGAYASAQESCDAFGGALQPNLQCARDLGKPWQSFYTVTKVWRCPTDPTQQSCVTYSCPSGYTLNGTMCDPACPADKREWQGQCLDRCKPLQNVNPANGQCECTNRVVLGIQENVDTSGEGSIPDSQCIGGCQFAIGDGIGLGGKFWYARREGATGQTCTTDSNKNDQPMPETKKPPCDPGQGVMTSSSGTVACVPEGLPGAKPPAVEQKEKKEVFPDGSERNTVETKTTDTKTGASHTHTTSTSTGGQAGSPGTSTTTEDKKADGAVEGGTGSSDGDGDGDCEGEDCGGGEGFKKPEGDLYDEGDRTIRQVVDEFVNGMKSAPIIQAATDFLDLGSMPSSCGGMTAAIPFIDVQLSLDEYLCGEGAQMIMTIASVIVMAMAAFAAFRIGFL